jgi:chromosome segregation ATPase
MADDHSAATDAELNKLMFILNRVDTQGPHKLSGYSSARVEEVQQARHVIRALRQRLAAAEQENERLAQLLIATGDERDTYDQRLAAAEQRATHYYGRYIELCDLLEKAEQAHKVLDLQIDGPTTPASLAKDA